MRVELLDAAVMLRVAALELGDKIGRVILPRRVDGQDGLARRLPLDGGGVGNGAFGGGFSRGGQFPVVVQSGDSGSCNRVSNCEVEKREIIDTARTQYLIEQQSNDTRMAINASTEAITSQASRIYEQRLQETIFDLKAENQSLKNNIFTKDQIDALSAKVSDCCCNFNRRLDGIEGRMLTKPSLYGVASTASGQLIPAACCGNNL